MPPDSDWTRCKLLLPRHKRIVEQDGVGGFAERGFFAGGVEEVALAEVGEDGFQSYLFALGCEFVIAAFGAHLVVGGNENFEFSVGEYYRADVPAIHYNRFVLSHLTLEVHHRLADKFEGGNLAHLARNFKCTYLVFNVFAVQCGVSVFQKRHFDIADVSLQRLLIDGIVGGNHTVAHCVQGNRAVHRAGVDVCESKMFGNLLCQCAFAARRMTVNGNLDFFHFPFFER